MAFIYCFDSELKDKLIVSGFKMVENSSGKDYWVFLNNPKNLTFNFNEVDSKKYKMSNRLNF